MRKEIILILFITILFSFVSTTQATPLINSTGLTNPPVTITFDEIVLPQGTQITNQYAPYGVTFFPSVYYDNQGPMDGYGISGISGHYIGNSNINYPFSINFIFPTPQMEAAFGLATNPGTTTLTALLNGTVVETFSLMTTYDNPNTAFVGFTGILFNEISISVTDIYGWHIALVDNIQDSPASVPEPATIFLIGSGLLGVACWMRRRLV